MKLTDILAKAGKKTARKRGGRGQGSGNGKTSGRGHNGAGQRSGFKKNRPAFEGGQMPLVRRTPKRGFTNAPFRRQFDVANVKLLEKWFEAGDSVSLDVLKSRGLIKPRHGRLKVLGAGELSKNLTIVADAISETARQKIEEAGGSVESTGTTDKK